MKISIAGDVMFGRWVNKEYHPSEFLSGSIEHPFVDVKDIFDGHQCNIVNLETVLTDDTPNIWNKYDFPDDFQSVLCSPTESTRALQQAGIDLVAYANNHAEDADTKGVEATLDTLARYSIGHAGASRSKGDPTDPFIRSVDGEDLALFSISFVRNRGKIWGTDVDLTKNNQVAFIENKRDIMMMYQKIRRHRNENPDHTIVVSVHWGKEYTTNVSNWQKTVGKALINAGCNVVMGHGSHVLGPVLRHKRGIIFFSLGNLYFDHQYDLEGHQSPTHPETQLGCIASLDVDENEVRNISIHYTRSTPEGVIWVKERRLDNE